jgi:hypothetical protein
MMLGTQLQQRIPRQDLLDESLEITEGNHSLEDQLIGFVGRSLSPMMFPAAAFVLLEDGLEKGDCIRSFDAKICFTGSIINDHHTLPPSKDRTRLGSVTIIAAAVTAVVTLVEQFVMTVVTRGRTLTTSPPFPLCHPWSG